MLPLEIQLFMGAVMVLTGVAVGLVYDVYRAARRLFRWRGILGELADLAFWVICAALLVCGLIAASWGAVRYHAFLALFAGLALYFSLAGPVLGPLWRAGFGGLQRLGGGARAALERLAAALGRLPRPRLGMSRPRWRLPRPPWPLRWPRERNPR